MIVFLIVIALLTVLFVVGFLLFLHGDTIEDLNKRIEKLESEKDEQKSS